jgi:hypothetical protein
MAGFGVAPVKTQSVTDDPNLEIARQEVDAGIRRGANWFYWIAILSVVNSVIGLGGSNARFIVGLGMTDMAGAARSIVSAIAVGGVVSLGYFANKRQKWAFIAGMALYAADAAILISLQQWLSAAFHAFVLYLLWEGFKRIAEDEELARRFQLHAV